MKKFIIALLTMVLLVGPTGSSQQQMDLTAARSYFNLSEYEKAIHFSRQALKNDPAGQDPRLIITDSFLTLTALAQANFLVDQLGDDLSTYHGSPEATVLRIFKTGRPALLDRLYSWLYYLRGRFFAWRNDPAKAELDFAASIKHDPTNYKSLLWLVKSLKQEFPGEISEFIDFLGHVSAVLPQIKKEKLYSELVR